MTKADTICVTQDDWVRLIREHGKRGVIRVMIGAIEISVPFWRVTALRKLAYDQAPISMRIDVRPLSVGEHFIVWGVRVLDLMRSSPPP